jgi:GTPase SAR1 family protein
VGALSGAGTVPLHHRRVRPFTRSHYRKALGALVVYDLTKYESFENVKKWIEGIREHASPNVVIVVVGNKLDLRKNSEQAVTANEGKKLAASLGVMFAETSAHTNENVESTFTSMLEGIPPFIQKSRSGRSRRPPLTPPRTASPSPKAKLPSPNAAADLTTVMSIGGNVGS